MASTEAQLTTLLVSLYVYGDNLNPSVISRELDAVPTRMQRKGETKQSTAGASIPVTVGMWELRSSCESLDLSEHVSNIFSQLANHTYIPSIDGVDDVHLDVYAPEMCAGDGYRYLDLQLSLPEVQVLAKLGASIRISIHIER